MKIQLPGFLQRMMNRATTPDRPVTVRIVPTVAAGVFVDADTALQNSVVWACVQYLSNAIAQLPWHVMQWSENGNASVARSHPVNRLLNLRPNDDMSAFTWRQTMVAHLLLRGNAYAEIERDMRGMPIALWPLHPDRVRVLRDGAGQLVYQVTNTTTGGNVLLSGTDMFHVRGLGDGAVGHSVIEYAAQSIGWARATEIFGATYFSSGMVPSSTITAPEGMTPEGLEELRASVKRIYSGPAGERTLILDAGMKFDPVTTNATDGQFIETRQHQVEEICRWFQVPPHKVMHLLRATFSNIEHQSIEVVTDTITPRVKLFEQEADVKLFGNNRQGFYSRMALQALMRGDNASRAQFYKTMSELGLTINQVLALEDMNGIGPDGDTVFVSNNVQTLQRAIEGAQQPAADPAPQPDSPDTADPPAADGDVTNE